MAKYLWGRWQSFGKPDVGLELNRKAIKVAKSSDARLIIFTIGDDNKIWHRLLIKSWEYIFTKNQIEQTIYNEQMLYAKIKKISYEKQSSTNLISHWRILGKATPVSPISTYTVGQNKDGRLEVFAISTNGKLWHIYQTNFQGEWSNWESFETETKDKFEPNPHRQVVVGQNQDGRLEVFIHDIKGKIWHRWQIWPNDGWSRWTSFSNPANVKNYKMADAVQDSAGKLTLFLKSSLANFQRKEKF